MNAFTVGLVIVLIVALLPVKVDCRYPGGSCATAPDKDGYIHYAQDVEPVFAYVIELATHSDFPIKYFETEKKVSIK